MGIVTFVTNFSNLVNLFRLLVKMDVTENSMLSYMALFFHYMSIITIYDCLYYLSIAHKIEIFHRFYLLYFICV